MSARPANLERIEARQTPAGNRQLSAPPRARLQARLFEPGLARCILSSYALLWAGTILFALIAVPFAGPLHEVFGLSGGLAAPGTMSMAALTLTNNAREAAIPFLFALLRVGARRWPIVLGNVVIAACFTADVALGGLALGPMGCARCRISLNGRWSGPASRSPSPPGAAHAVAVGTRSS